ncbi:MAG: adenylate/guanylate cyclase domain-containing protein [Anaerolineales bacterium]
MTKELSKKDQKMKEMLEKSLSSSEKTWFSRSRQFFGILPSDPRCTLCHSPFEGVGGTFVKTFLNRRRSHMNPLICNHCEEAAKRTNAGVETKMSMLFADIRGSTPLAESMSAVKFKHLIEKFYTEATSVLTHSMAMIDKLSGDEVSGFYLPGYLGKDYASAAVAAAKKILRVTGHTNPDGPWAPVGVGINTGTAYFGVVGNENELVEITGLGDEVNVAARLASQAAAGEIILSNSTVSQAGLDTNGLEKRTLELKGKSKPIDAWVMHASQI